MRLYGGGKITALKNGHITHILASRGMLWVMLALNAGVVIAALTIWTTRWVAIINLVLCIVLGYIAGMTRDMWWV